MDLGSLEIFKAVVEEGGVNKAALRLHRVPSNVTTRVKQLEEEVGAKLFVRDGRRLALTSEGMVLLEYAERLLRLSAEAHAAVRSDQPRGLLKIGSPENTAAVRLPSLLATFHETYPQVQMELVTDTTASLANRVIARELEAAFLMEPFNKPGFELQFAFDEELVLIVPRSHGRVRGPADLENPTVVSFDGGCSCRRMLVEWLLTANIHPRRVMEFESFQAIIAVVAAGSGISFVPRSVLDLAPARREVKVITLPPRTARSRTYLAWRPTHRSSALEAFRKLLADSGKLKKAA